MFLDDLDRTAGRSLSIRLAPKVSIQAGEKVAYVGGVGRVWAISQFDETQPMTGQNNGAAQAPLFALVGSLIE